MGISKCTSFLNRQIILQVNKKTILDKIVANTLILLFSSIISKPSFTNKTKILVTTISDSIKNILNKTVVNNRVFKFPLYKNDVEKIRMKIKGIVILGFKVIKLQNPKHIIKPSLAYLTTFIYPSF
ncbi:hypothetical protein QES_1259 [Clostridioides difficile CD149]|nr:hypothetical protein QAW_1186 [Clostridioides difficile CD17]EQE37682.1 hypothetical protein QC7_1038 [Clostridioides difficile CD38]EQE44991.1 hypothetical protein QCC_0936 [Clostridioides difficile CD41]EQE55546.1 hypothetical protein QCG_1224 [Clostridioides difficile CD43]EQE64765.1 hypothetical protein QCM_0916 [Clostridioides difficile CD46]EQE67911.1 hypothetical protein QCK_1062 [Clostridioides difficile CD45]EQE80004.1 hypothetical protein QCS_0960 [Clostridioides difficile CD51]